MRCVILPSVRFVTTIVKWPKRVGSIGHLLFIYIYYCYRCDETRQIFEMIPGIWWEDLHGDANPVWVPLDPLPALISLIEFDIVAIIPKTILKNIIQHPQLLRANYLLNSNGLTVLTCGGRSFQYNGDRDPLGLASGNRTVTPRSFFVIGFWGSWPRKNIIVIITIIYVFLLWQLHLQGVIDIQKNLSRTL